MIGVCCDSGAQLPAALAREHRIEVVPLTVTIDGRPHLEGVDLDADAFWSAFEDGRSPELSTAAPSPGQFFDAYERLVRAGATAIVSVHTGSELSATFDAARLGAEAVDVPVELVDTGSASFVVGCAALAAAEHVDAGGGASGAADVARRVSAEAGNVFVVGTLDLARAGGRLAHDVEDADSGTVPVLRLLGGEMVQVGDARTSEDAARQMASEVLAVEGPLRVGIALADDGSRTLAVQLRELLEDTSRELDLIEYRVGPSVGVHTGPGTAGAVYHPLSAIR